MVGWLPRYAYISRACARHQLMTLIWIIHCFAVKNACPGHPNKEGCGEGTAARTPVAFRFAGLSGVSDQVQQTYVQLTLYNYSPHIATHESHRACWGLGAG